MKLYLCSFVSKHFIYHFKSLELKRNDCWLFYLFLSSTISELDHTSCLLIDVISIWIDDFYFHKMLLNANFFSFHSVLIRIKLNWITFLFVYSSILFNSFWNIESISSSFFHFRILSIHFLCVLFSFFLWFYVSSIFNTLICFSFLSLLKEHSLLSDWKEWYQQLQ